MTKKIPNKILEQRELIDCVAELLAARLDIFYPITSMKSFEAVLQKVRGVIRYSENMDNEYHIERYDDHFVLWLEADLNEQRQIYLVSQALGFLFIHMRYLSDMEFFMGDDADFVRIISNMDYYIQAIEFAHAFLLPYKLFKRSVEGNTTHDVVDVDKIAEDFGVEMRRVIHRARVLRFIV